VTGRGGVGEGEGGGEWQGEMTKWFRSGDLGCWVLASKGGGGGGGGGGVGRAWLEIVGRKDLQAFCVAACCSVL